MSVLIPVESQMGKEAWKWEHEQGMSHPTDPTVKGMRPREYQPYPARLYKVISKNPWQFEAITVADEHEQRNMESRGFVAGGQGKACEAYDRDMQTLAVAAAERNYDDRRMSDAAKAERDAVEQTSRGHLGEIPARPKRKYVKKVKTNDAA